MKGIRVILHERTDAGVDGLNNPVCTYGPPVAVDNVLVGSPSVADITGSTQLDGKRTAFVLAIPKGDGHRWEDAVVEFFGRRYRCFGPVEEGIEALVPTAWHKKVQVERIE